MISFGHLSSIWTDLTTYHTAEIRAKTAGQCALMPSVSLMIISYQTAVEQVTRRLQSLYLHEPAAALNPHTVCFYTDIRSSL